MKRKAIVLPGDRFGRMTIIKEVGTIVRSPTYYDRMFLCRCDCGNEKVVSLYHLKGGGTSSCGCLRAKRGIIGGESNDANYIRKRLYVEWRSMKTRCSPNNQKYRSRYFNRGITVCAEWMDSFNMFYEWSIKNGFNLNLSLDRIDNNNGYSPDNCRWATPKEQANNTRKNVIITFNGVSHTLAKWAEIMGINKNTLYSRRVAGWPDEKIITTPSRGY